VLVVYLQRRALVALDHQTNLILQKICEQTAATAAAEIRRTLDGPVLDTLTDLGHPILRAGRLDVVATEYAEGLKKYPQVERFFLWSAQTREVASGEVLFYGGRRDALEDRAGLEGFYRDPLLGKVIYALVERYRDSGELYTIVQTAVAGTSYDVFLRFFWEGGVREEYYAILGFVVNLHTVKARVFRDLYGSRLSGLIRPVDGSPPLELRILDEAGRPVFETSGNPVPALAGRAPFSLQFYPNYNVGSRIVVMVPERNWTAEVSPSTDNAPVALTLTQRNSYGLLGLSVFLMFIALVFAFQGKKRVEHLAHMQAEFVFHVSHQLRTPLTALSAVSETLVANRSHSPEKLRRYLEIVHTETMRLSRLVEHVLHFSRVEEGRWRFEFQPVDLAQLVRETVDAFRNRRALEEFRIAFEEQPPPPVVNADTAAIEQVLVNLLDNAAKYSDQIKEIAVRVKRVAGEAVIEVADKGIGISAGDLPWIFEKFSRRETGANHRPGFGLGLTIAQELVWAHRGRIDVESVPGEGSTFRVRFPICLDSPPVAAEADGGREARPEEEMEPATLRSSTELRGG